MWFYYYFLRGGVVEEGINLHQYLCTFGEEKGISLIKTSTTFTIKGREKNRFFCYRPWFIHLGTLYHNVKYSRYLLLLTCETRVFQNWRACCTRGGKVKAGAVDGQNSEAFWARWHKMFYLMLVRWQTRSIFLHLLSINRSC